MKLKLILATAIVAAAQRPRGGRARRPGPTVPRRRPPPARPGPRSRASCSRARRDWRAPGLSHARPHRLTSAVMIQSVAERPGAPSRAAARTRRAARAAARTAPKFSTRITSRSAKRSSERLQRPALPMLRAYTRALTTHAKSRSVTGWPKSIGGQARRAQRQVHVAAQAQRPVTEPAQQHAQPVRAREHARSA